MQSHQKTILRLHRMQTLYLILDIVNVWWCRCVQTQCTYSATQGTSQAKYDGIAEWRKNVRVKHMC